MNKKEVDNDLQKLDKRTKRKINALTAEAVLKIRPVSVFDADPKTVDKMVKEAFDSINYDKRLTDIITGASVEGANLALQNIGTVSVDKYIDYELAKTYDGVKLSSLIRSSAKDAEKSVSAVVKQNLKEGTNWKKLSKDIQQVDKVGDIAGAVSDLAAQAKRLGVDVTAQKKEVLQYVKRLSPNGAPNQQLKNAYMGVIKAVESKDTVIIDKALEKAVKAKITYNAERISRTEIATGYGQAFMQRIELDEDATGFKWLLSARHPVTDECFPSGVKINCLDGLKNIEDINIGDTVLTHNGRYKTVSNIGKSNNMIFDFTFQNKKLNLETIPCTTNHPFLTAKGWIPAICVEDYNPCILIEPYTYDKERLALCGVPHKDKQDFQQNVHHLDLKTFFLELYDVVRVFVLNDKKNNAYQGVCQQIDELFYDYNNNSESSHLANSGLNDQDDCFLENLLLLLGVDNDPLCVSYYTSDYVHQRKSKILNSIFDLNNLEFQIQSDNLNISFCQPLPCGNSDNNRLSKIFSLLEFLIDFSYLSCHKLDTLQAPDSALQYQRIVLNSIFEGSLLLNKNPLSKLDTACLVVLTLSHKLLDKVFLQSYIKYSLSHEYKPQLFYKTGLNHHEIDTVYNLQVEDDSSYIANGFIVHNCDFYATLDNGAGKGVYKKGDFPSLPAHPNCLCSLVPYYEDPPAKTTAENSRRHLDSMPGSKRAKVIGKESSEYKSRYIEGLKKHGIDLNNKPVKLPVEIINILPKG